MRKELVVAVALFALCWVTARNNEAFTNPTNLKNTTRQIALLGVFAIGVGVVIITGGIDLSVGSLIALTAVVFAKLSASPANNGLGHPVWLATLEAMGVALFCGLFQGILIARIGLQPFIVTLCGMLYFRGIAQTITQGGNLTISATDNPEFRFFTEQGIHFRVRQAIDAFGEPMVDDLGKPIFDEFVLTSPVIIFGVIMLAMIYLWHFTVFGRHLYAIGGNREAARYAGVPVQATETAAYVISAGLSGVAGLLYASYLGDITHTMGTSYELYAIAAAVLGGCSLRGGEGSVIGVALGVALFRVLENGINMLQPLVDQAVRNDKLIWPLNHIISQGWRLDNSREIVIGSVILGAVLFDQFAQAVRDYRRRRRAK